MGVTIVLTGWLIALGIALFACRFASRRYYLKTIILGCLVLGLVLSPFSRSLIASPGPDETLSLAGLEQAFLGIWLLILLPLLQQRLDRTTVIGSLRHGLVALAMTVMIVDIAGFPLFSAFPELDPVLVMLCLMGAIFFIGFIFCLIMTENLDFPWDYPAWFSGLLILVQPSRDSLHSLPLTVYEGAALLAVTYIFGLLLFGILRCFFYPSRA